MRCETKRAEHPWRITDALAGIQKIRVDRSKNRRFPFSAAAQGLQVFGHSRRDPGSQSLIGIWRNRLSRDDSDILQGPTAHVVGRRKLYRRTSVMIARESASAIERNRARTCAHARAYVRNGARRVVV